MPKKFHRIDIKENLIAKLPGRIKCDCGATKHTLINNCLNCGRIVCEQEGAGPCWFCGDLVCDNNDYDKIQSNSNKGKQLQNLLMSMKWPHQDENKIENTTSNLDEHQLKLLKEAEEKKQRLLHFDKNNSKNAVIDDQREYYNTGSHSWMSAKDRANLQMKEKALKEERFMEKWKRERKVNLITGEVTYEGNENVLDQLFDNPDASSHDVNPIDKDASVETDFLEFVSENNKYKTSNNEKDKLKSRKQNIRNQCDDLNMGVDKGMCLSMHQPWASLLVNGIKKHEGRSWYTSYRGKLWIASTAKEPCPTDIEHCKQFYINRGEVTPDDFPKNYPVACLIGSVELVDCLTDDHYKTDYPDGESDSPYVFICENPKELPMKFPIKGKHKIYKLEPYIHNAAKSSMLM